MKLGVKNESVRITYGSRKDKRTSALWNIARALSALPIMLLASATIASAQVTVPDDLRISTLTPGAPQSPAGVPVPLGPLPPIGSGLGNPPPLIQGDAPGSELPPPTGAADPTTGSNFGTKPEQVVNQTNYAMNVPGATSTFGATRQQPSGKRIVLTNNTDGGGEKAADDPSLDAMQEAQYPSPYKGMGAPGGVRQLSLDFQRSVANRAQKLPDRPRKTDSAPFVLPFGDPITDYDGQKYLSKGSKLVKVRPFARWLVKVGVVFATVMMIFSAYAMILGHRDGGSRVMSTAGGLILILMAYTIWKVVMLNTQYLGKFTPANPDQIFRLKSPNRVNPSPANTPAVPADPGGVARANMKVLPMGAQILR